MRIDYDQNADAMYIRFFESPYQESDEVRPGVIVDYDAQGRVIGLEILDVSKNVPTHFLQELMSPEVRVKVERHAVA